MNNNTPVTLDVRHNVAPRPRSAIPFALMQPGDSVHVPDALIGPGGAFASDKSLRVRACMVGKKLGKRFLVRKEDGGFGVFCVGIVEG